MTDDFWPRLSAFFETYDAALLQTLMTMMIILGSVIGAQILASRLTARMQGVTTLLHNQRARVLVYMRIARVFITVIGMALLLVFVWRIWNGTDGFYHDALRAIRFVGRQLFLVLFFLSGWEILYWVVRRKLTKKDGTLDQRAATLFPFIMNILFIFLGCVFAFMFLSEIGVNIAPLLTGAGVAGLAVGLGAQQSIRDLIAGVTLILEDVIRVGDVVNIAGMGGLVERITLRKIQLRDYNGAVYTVPYSEIKVIQNLTKDFSFYVGDINVAYDSDLDKVFRVLKEIGDAMRADPAFGPRILDNIEIAGVDQFRDNAILIKIRMKTRPIAQWDVGREFNRRLKSAFQENGIAIPYPQRTLHIKSDAPLPVAMLAAQDDALSGKA